MNKEKIQELTNELKKVTDMIEDYNDSESDDTFRADYLTERKYQLIKELKDLVFGNNVELM